MKTGDLIPYLRLNELGPGSIIRAANGREFFRVDNKWRGSQKSACVWSDNDMHGPDLLILHYVKSEKVYEIGDLVTNVELDDLPLKTVVRHVNLGDIAVKVYGAWDVLITRTPHTQIRKVTPTDNFFAAGAMNEIIYLPKEDKL